MTFRKERNDRFAGPRVRTLKELWVRRVSRTVFVSPRATTGVATARGSRVCPFAFAGPLTVSPSRRPLSIPAVDTLRRCRERQVEGPRSRNRAPSPVVAALHLFRRSFAAGRGPASPFRCLPPRDPFAVPPGSLSPSSRDVPPLSFFFSSISPPAAAVVAALSFLPGQPHRSLNYAARCARLFLLPDWNGPYGTKSNAFRSCRERSR